MQKSEITSNDALTALQHLILTSQAPSRLLAGKTISLSSNRFINEKKANCSHGVTEQTMEGVRSLSNSDCVS